MSSNSLITQSLQDTLINYAHILSKKRVLISNSNNGYAYHTCIVFDKKKPYYVLQRWYQSLRN